MGSHTSSVSDMFYALGACLYGKSDFREYGSGDRQVSCEKLVFFGNRAGHLAHFREPFGGLLLGERAEVTASLRNIILCSANSSCRSGNGRERLSPLGSSAEERWSVSRLQKPVNDSCRVYLYT